MTRSVSCNLTGSGGVFSSGMDLKSFLAGETAEVGQRGVCGITVDPPEKPVIGAVEGWARGSRTPVSSRL